MVLVELCNFRDRKFEKKKTQTSQNTSLFAENTHVVLLYVDLDLYYVKLILLCVCVCVFVFPSLFIMRCML